MRSALGKALMASPMNRRRVLAGVGASLAALPLAGCDSQNSTVRDVLENAEGLTECAQRLLLSRQSLAQEFSEARISAPTARRTRTTPLTSAFRNRAFRTGGWRLPGWSTHR